mgnify:CR=1 FL=1|jgi:hypothetical protein
MKIKITSKRLWLYFFISKIIYMFSAIFVYSKFSPLVDTHSYLTGVVYDPQLMFSKSTQMIGTIAYSFSLILGPVLANVPFVILSFYGIYYAVSRIDLTNKQLTILLILLSFPTFGIYSSVASKEAIAVFFMGVILGFIIDIIKKRHVGNYLLIVIAFYLCILFKPQYMIGISALLIYLFLSRILRLKGYGKLFLLVLFFIVSFGLLYIFRYEINAISFNMPKYFSLKSNSTRENTFWIDDFDVFKNALYGMYIAFVGPTFTEATQKTTHLFAWIESMIILSTFAVGSLKLYLVAIKTYKLNIYYLSIFLTVTLWILFVHYPFGVLNPGSAIRYRENFYGFLVILFYFLYTETLNQYYQNLEIKNKIQDKQ